MKASEDSGQPAIRAVRSESSLSVFRIEMGAKFLHVDNEDWSDCADAEVELSLCEHYENTPIQIYWKFLHWKL